MHQYHGCCVVLQGDLNHFPWVHAGPIQRAVKQLLKYDNPVLGVEQQKSKDFVLMVLQQWLQVAEDLLRLSQCSACWR